MKTEITFDNAAAPTEGLLIENRYDLERGKTWRDLPSSDAMTVTRDSDGTAEKRFNDILTVRPVTVRVVRFITESCTWVFADYEVGKDCDGLSVPRYFQDEELCCGEDYRHHGRLYDENGEELAQVWFAKRAHTIEEAGVWQKEGKALAPLMTAKKLSPAQLKRNIKAAKAKMQIDKEGLSLIQKEWTFIKNQTDKQRGSIVSRRCATGKWAHNEKCKTVVRRRDGNPITGRYIVDVMKKIEPRKKRLP